MEDVLESMTFMEDGVWVEHQCDAEH